MVDIKGGSNILILPNSKEHWSDSAMRTEKQWPWRSTQIRNSKGRQAIPLYIYNEHDRRAFNFIVITLTWRYCLFVYIKFSTNLGYIRAVLNGMENYTFLVADLVRTVDQRQDFFGQTLFLQVNNKVSTNIDRGLNTLHTKLLDSY